LAEKTVQKVGEILGLSIRVIVVTAVVMILFGIYVGVLMYGDNSLTVLNQLKQQKKELLAEASRLKSENQRLQKEFFELKQLEGGEE
jgi:cell division protein FtsB